MNEPKRQWNETISNDNWDQMNRKFASMVSNIKSYGPIVWTKVLRESIGKDSHQFDYSVTPKNCRIWMTIIFVLSVLKLVEIFFSNLYRENRCESVSNSNWKTKEKIERKSIEHMKVTRTHFLFFSFWI